jgi:hypothetical protein
MIGLVDCADGLTGLRSGGDFVISRITEKGAAIFLEKKSRVTRRGFADAVRDACGGDTHPDYELSFEHV